MTGPGEIGGIPWLFITPGGGRDLSRLPQLATMFMMVSASSGDTELISGQIKCKKLENTELKILFPASYVKLDPTNRSGSSSSGSCGDGDGSSGSGCDWG